MPSSPDERTVRPVLPPTCVVTTKAEAIYRDKGDGTKVSYYLFSEYEIHANTLDAGSVQGWHHHDRILETLFVTGGSLEARWVDEDGRVTVRRLDQGDLITVGSSVHTFANPFGEPAEFLVFRLVPDGTDKRDLIKGDRHADDPPPGA